MKQPRKVEIKMARDTYLVAYTDRKKGQRYNAAGFYGKDFTREQVVEWIRNQPALELVEGTHG